MTDSQVVYWAPFHDPKNKAHYELIVKEPESLMKYIRDNSNNVKKENDLAMCPSAKSIFKNVFYIKNPVKLDLSLEDARNPINRESHKDLTLKYYVSPPSLKMHKRLNYNLTYIFFSETPLKMRVTAPYFHNSPHLKYGATAPGEFDIGQWFRPAGTDFLIWNGIDEIKIEKEEPVMYIEFFTDKKIKFERFEMTEKLMDNVRANLNFRGYEPYKPLNYLYNLFNKSGSKSSVIREIKKNLV